MTDQTHPLNLPNTLLMVDGSNFMFRAYHAMPDLVTSQGLPSGALFGMGQMLRTLRGQYPTPWAVCLFDHKDKTFRHELDASYKANRALMPDALAAQIPALEQMAAALGWRVLKISGIEADDVIGTLADQATRRGIDCLIATGDKDMAQLVKPHIRLLNTMKDQIIDEAGVFEKFGVRPDQIIDYLTLMGDASDNIKGVDKVGPKTAAKWLNEYETLDNLLAHASEIKGVVGENLRAAQSYLPQSKYLVQIRCDADLSAHIAQYPDRFDDLAWRGIDLATLEPICQQYELRGLLNWAKATQQKESQQNSGQVSLLQHDDSNSQTVNQTASNYQTILTQTQLDVWLEKINQASLVGFDTETNSLDPMSAQLVGLSFAVAEGDAAYLPVLLTGVDAPAHLSLESVLAQLKPWLENPNAHKVMQHAKYDMHVLANQGIQLAGVVHDTMLQSYVLNSAQSHNLEALIHREIGVSCLSYEDVCGKGAKQIPFSQVDVALATRYAAEDADMTLRVHHRLWQRLVQDDKARAVYETMELPLQRVLFLMERTGVLIDEQALRTQGHELSQTMQELEVKAFELVGHPFNLQSPKQVAQVLFDEMGIPSVRKTASGTPSTDEGVLSQLADDYPLPKLLLEHRTCAKLKGTYTDGLLQMINPTTHRVHTRYAQAVVNTGRLSSQDPNLQNIPIKTSAGKRIREAFVAPDGWQIISADYSQIELRIMAHLSNDAGLMKAFINGEDVHRQTASEIFGTPLSEISSEQRRYAKTINFGLIYGMSAFGLSKSLGIARDAAKLYMDRYFQRYPNVLHYMENIRKTARNDGFVETICGRRLWISGLDSSNAMMRQGAERAAINAPMQGSAADLIKLAMIEVSNWLHREKLESRLLMQVHDELVLEVPSHEIERIQQALPELMTNVMPLHVPLEVEVGVGSTWGKAH